MKDNRKFVKALRVVNRYLVFFLFIGFVISCCMFLFVETMADAMGIVFTEDNISSAAKVTFANVILLTIICTTIDIVRQKIRVDQPVKRITQAAHKIIDGDFSARIEPIKDDSTGEPFNEIIECFNMMAEELSHTETLRTDFVANVSHELKTPLAVMQNYATMLQEPNLPEEKRIEYAKAISDASRRLAGLISNILKLNKLENQSIVLNAQTYDLGEQLCETLISFEDLWERKEIAIDTEIEEGIIVSADAEMMTIVWGNLFSNALKFTEQGGLVRLKLFAEDDKAVVKVSDTGCGIPKEVGKRMFDKFYQGDTSHATQGNGLGLALVKRIIDITGSEISVESEVGKGSTFTVKMRRNTNGTIQKDTA